MTQPERPVNRRSENPRRVVGGHRLRRADSFGPWPWPAEGWLTIAAPSSADEESEGLAYARSGQIAALTIEPGIATTKVQGRLPRPHAVEIAWPILEEAVIDAVVAGLAADAAASASVLLGDVPRLVGELFERAGRPFLPESKLPPTIRCSCGRPTGCRHMVATALVLQERIASDPWSLLRLRGLVREDLQDRVRLLRRSASEAAAPPKELAPGSPLPASIESFWRPGPAIAELASMPPAEHAPMALLRRLGPSPLDGRFPLVGLLASAYETIAREGRSLAATGDDEPLALDAPSQRSDAVAAVELSEPVARPAPAPRSLGRAVAKRKAAPKREL